MSTDKREEPVSLEDLVRAAMKGPPKKDWRYLEKDEAKDGRKQDAS